MIRKVTHPTVLAAVACLLAEGPAFAAPEAAPAEPAVQLGAFSSSEAARRAGMELVWRSPETLAERRLSIRAAQRGQATFYRTLLLGFSSTDEANHACQHLRSLGEHCLVVDAAKKEAP